MRSRSASKFNPEVLSCIPAHPSRGWLAPLQSVIAGIPSLPIDNTLLEVDKRMGLSPENRWHLRSGRIQTITDRFHTPLLSGNCPTSSHKERGAALGIPAKQSLLTCLDNDFCLEGKKRHRRKWPFSFLRKIDTKDSLACQTRD